jgi:hypothetical protein
MKHYYNYNFKFKNLKCYFFLIFGFNQFVYAQVFSDIAPLYGITQMGNLNTFGNGVSFYDFDNDGFDDIIFAPNNDSVFVFKSNNGNLQKLNTGIFLPHDVKQVLWVDYDNDGLLDLFFTVNMGTCRLYKQTANLSFIDVTFESGLASQGNTIRHYGASFADFNKDGYLDLYICTYHAGEQPVSHLNKLFRNTGNGTFIDISAESGTLTNANLSFQSAVFDANNDSWPDIFVVNDKIFLNNLFLNNQNLTFVDMAAASGVSMPAQNSMGAAIGDYNNSGFLDIFVTNTSGGGMYSHLLKNSGLGTFGDVGNIVGVGENGVSWGAAWIDYDNDSYLDLYVANSGLGYGQGVSSNVFYRNVQGLYFEEYNEAFPEEQLFFSYGVAMGDLNNDGFSDLAISNASPMMHVVNLNSGNNNNYIKVTLQGTLSNHYAIGSYIRVYVGEHVYTQYTLCGEGYLSQNSQHHIFGLAQFNTVDSLVVIFPSGVTERQYNLAVNQHYHIIEGNSITAFIQPPGPINICEGQSVTLDAGIHDGYLWNNGHSERFFNTSEAGSYSVTVNTNGIIATSPAVVVNLFPEPNIEKTLTEPSCNGYDDGSVTFNNINGTGFNSILWNNSPLASATISNLSAGIYNYIFIDVNACIAQGIVNLTEPEPLMAAFILLPQTANQLGMIDCNIFGGSPPYSVEMNGQEVDFPVEELYSGIYFFILKDANSCILEQELELPFVSNIFNTAQEEQIRVYPLPFDERLFIYSAKPIDSFSLFDLSGKVIKKGELLEGKIEDLNKLSAGSYILCLNDNTGKAYYQRVIKN